ncbi:MAG: hypothetical protein WA369_05800 [Candidatus Acidiferrales bacterium]
MMNAQRRNRGKLTRLAVSAGHQASGTSSPARTEMPRVASPIQPSGPSPEHLEKIAHDFNNILTLVLGYGEHLLKILPEDHRGRSFAEEICRAAKDGERLSIELADSAHPAKAERIGPAAH